MTELMAAWAAWMRPSAGLPTVQWSILLAVAAAAGHLLHRHAGVPKVVGYCIVGAIAGLGGFSSGAWPLEGIALFLLELAVSIVLFQAGGRIPLRWFRHNPMVLLQSLLESVLTAAAVYFALRAFDVRPAVAQALGLVAVASSPAVLGRVIADTRASGPVTERTMTLATLSTLYALTFANARAGVMHREAETLVSFLLPVGVVLGVSLGVAAVLALVLQVALRFMSPTSENTSMLVIALIAAATAVASHLGGSAPLAALLSGIVLKQFHPRPWAWPGQLDTASSLLTMLMFVLVSVVAAKAPWSPAVAGWVAALVAARAIAKVAGVVAANWGSGTSWRQAAWTGIAMSPMSSVGLLLASQFAAASLTAGPWITMIALPAILLMEVLGALLCTVALHRVRETAAQHASEGSVPAGAVRD